MVNYKCLTSEQTDDNFVGIRFDKNGNPEVVFPHGYHLPSVQDFKNNKVDEAEMRKEVFSLLHVLSVFGRQRNGTRSDRSADTISAFPIQSYQYIIYDFFSHGYYTEKETVYTEATKGKISWKRTIQKEKPQLSGNNPVYLQFQVKTVKNNTDNLLSKIHRYCVYESFQRFGWLYLGNDYLPPNPNIHCDPPLFLSVLRTELSHTFNDNKKQLLNSMIHIISNTKEDTNFREGALGVNHFASVWEQLVDHVFGEDETTKKKYFPHASWYVYRDKKFTQSTALEPDTIMLHDNKCYVLDSKYYKYGITDDTGDLPNTSSIQKQITYGRYIANNPIIINDTETREYTKDKVFSAFVLPFDCQGKEQILDFVAVGTGKWEKTTVDPDANYQYVLGVLLDTRHLITTYTEKNATEIINLANLIEKSLQEHKAEIIDKMLSEN